MSSRVSDEDLDGWTSISLVRFSSAGQGSFVDTARKLNITQSTVSARIKKGLEDLLGRPLFTRSKSGAELTGAGGTVSEARSRHGACVAAGAASGFSGGSASRTHFRFGAPLSLWSGFLLKWAGRIEDPNPRNRCIRDRWSVAGAEPEADRRNARSRNHVSAIPAAGPHDRAPLRPRVACWFLERNRPAARRGVNDYLLIDWGTDFIQDHATVSFRNTRTLRCTLTSARWGSTILGQRMLRIFPPLAWGARAESAEGGCGSRSGRESSSIRSTWSIRRRATMRAYEPILRGLRRAAAKLG